MNPIVVVRSLLWGGLTLVGAVVTGVTGFLVIRGPFLGGRPLEPRLLLVATGGFMLGVIVFALGGSKLARMVTG